nr:immunoglobulin heavy chain junction region [Macaca mulatta]MOW90320.1 immunoglobulin heavy chain junction region [Macaca mulatta]MOW91768.1 immunoglobulin heavy chain junction region [Macaca mulatta]MOW91787.1 immunoglobulin heavy chain junction region [Macaca mulatta]MOW92113.1 immunoglobulin heavy chain junction region [Macaca mulatta]
CARQDTNYDYW